MKLAVPRLTYDPPLSLAMYYELAAHLSQIPALKPKLLRWQDLDQGENMQQARQFDYEQSQVAALQLDVEPDLLEELVVFLEGMTCLTREISAGAIHPSSSQQVFIGSLQQTTKLNQMLDRLLYHLLSQILAQYGCWRSY